MELVALLLRHGLTDLNEEGLLKGRTDVELDERGIAQAKESSGFLAKYPIQRIMCSPLIRAYRTAMEVCDVTGISPIQTRELFPWDIGNTFVDVPKKDSGLQEYVDNPGRTPPNGESLNALFKRVHGFFSEELTKGVLTLFATHNSVIITLDELLKDAKSRKKRHPVMEGIIAPGGVVGVFRNDKAFEMQPLFGELDKQKYAS